MHLAHNLHLILHLLIQHSILNEAAFLELLGSVRFSVIFGCDFVNNRKGSLANHAYPVVFAGSSPLSSHSSGIFGL